MMEQETAQDRTPAEKVMAAFMADGRFVQLPVRQGMRLLALRVFAARFEKGRTYAEKEVNAIIQALYPDYCTVRRELMDFGFMERHGGEYRLLKYGDETETGAQT